VKHEPDGTVSVLMECPHCENYEWHAQVSPDDHQHFQCRLCFATFTYQSN
jgi:transposase-like protein